jgi:hypothetical protein
MSTRIIRGQANLLAVSKARDIVRAKREWSITYAFEDLGTAVGACELCDHPDIRYTFEIENTQTGRHLWVGSECIKKFVPIFEAGVEVTNEGHKAKIVERIASTVRTRGRRERAVALLDQLAKRDRRFGEERWRDDWDLGYSAKQLQWIAVTARRASLAFNAADFRINTRRGRVLEQLYQLQDWQYRQLRLALTQSRRNELDAHFGLVNRTAKR